MKLLLWICFRSYLSQFADSSTPSRIAVSCIYAVLVSLTLSACSASQNQNSLDTPHLTQQTPAPKQEQIPKRVSIVNKEATKPELTSNPLRAAFANRFKQVPKRTRVAARQATPSIVPQEEVPEILTVAEVDTGPTFATSAGNFLQNTLKGIGDVAVVGMETALVAAAVAVYVPLRVMAELSKTPQGQELNARLITYAITGDKRAFSVPRGGYSNDDDYRGCCSYHRGIYENGFGQKVCHTSGRLLCNDGTPSPSCSCN